MNIIVFIKQVPGTNKVEVDPVTGVLKRDGVDSKMNPYDLFALESALRLKEEYGGTVKVISMGPPQATEIIKEAYSMGADEGILLSDRKFAGADVLATSYALSQGARCAGDFDIIICGKQTTDGDTAQVGSEISEWLSLPAVANVTQINAVTENSITVTMDLPNAVEVSEISFPCLVSVDKDIFQPRLPSYVKKCATKDREIKILSFNDMEDKDEKRYGLSGSPTQVQKIFPPQSQGAHDIWTGSGDEMSAKLFDKLDELKFI